MKKYVLVIASYAGACPFIQYIGRNQSNNKSRRLLWVKIQLISLSNIMDVDHPSS